MMGRLAGAVVATLLIATRARAEVAQPQLVGPHAFALLAGRPATVRAGWRAVAGATHYRVTWKDVEADVTDTAFESIETTAGRHTLSIVAVDKDGHAGPAAHLQIDVVAIAATSPGDTTASTRTGAPAYAIGTRFASPGTPCSLGGSPAAPAIQAHTAGRPWLACGEVSEPIIVAPVIVATEPPPPLVRETATTLHVTVASVAPLGDRLDVEAIGELDLGEAQRTEGGFDVAVTPRTDATAVGLRVMAGDLELGRVALPLSDRVAMVAPPRPRPAWFAVDAGVLAGVFSPAKVGASATHLGHPSAPADTLATGGSFAGHVGFFPLRKVGLEVQVAYVPTGYASGGGTSTLLVERIQLAVRAVDDHRYGLRLLAGGDVLTERARRGTSRHATDGGLHYGAAFTIGVTRALAVRIEAMHLITTSLDAGYASSFVAQVGVVTRFGRRDR